MFFCCCNNFIGRNIFSKINYIIPIVAKHQGNKILSDIVNITLYCSNNDCRHFFLYAAFF